MSELDDVLRFVVEDIDCVLLFNPDASFYEKAIADENSTIVVIASENSMEAERFIEIPIEFTDVAERIRFGIEGAVDQTLIADDDNVVCVTSIFAEGSDTITRVRASEVSNSGLYDFFVRSRAKRSVIRNIVELAIELGKKGQKGEPVGALFTIGDAGRVMNKSRALSHNPFERSHVHIGDPIINIMLKEFSRLDGAFVVSDAGKIASAYRYLEPVVDGVDIPKGLGTRHWAAAAITKETSAITIVLSESDRRVRGFKNGNLVFDLDPDRY